MKVAAVQMDIVWHDRAANHDTFRRLAAEARDAGADLLVFPEMAATGFSMDAGVTAEPLDGPTPTLFRQLAESLNLTIVGGFVLQRETGRPRNVSLTVGPTGQDLALYAKIHQIGLLLEDQYYDPGNRTVSFHVGGMEAAALVCYDLRFPEVFRTLADRCGLIIVIASWPAVRQLHWDILLPARAVENQLYIVGVNRVGEGGGHLFTGGSAIIDPSGEPIVHANDRETLIIADVLPQRVQQVRTEMPFLKDRKANYA